MIQKLRRSFWVAALLWAAQCASAQSMLVKDLAVGRLLVAPRDAPDPRFDKSVILLLQRNGQSALGLFVNRRTKIPISRALADWKTAKDKSDPVYLGGPVELNGLMALLRATSKPGGAVHVAGDIYLATGRKLVENTLEAGKGPSELRIYLGYCGWGAGQLENEVKLGVWYIFSGSADLVFDSDPASLWSRLIARTELQIARNACTRRDPFPFRKQGLNACSRGQSGHPAAGLDLRQLVLETERPLGSLYRVPVKR